MGVTNHLLTWMILEIGDQKNLTVIGHHLAKAKNFDGRGGPAASAYVSWLDQRVRTIGDVASKGPRGPGCGCFLGHFAEVGVVYHKRSGCDGFGFVL